MVRNAMNGCIDVRRDERGGQTHERAGDSPSVDLYIYVGHASSMSLEFLSSLLNLYSE